LISGGGGHVRTALVQYLTSDVASYLRGSYLEERKDMFSVASEHAPGRQWLTCAPHCQRSVVGVSRRLSNSTHAPVLS
jgi:hypothetical protein